jgi:hypothetical protein
VLGGIAKAGVAIGLGSVPVKTVRNHGGVGPSPSTSASCLVVASRRRVLPLLPRRCCATWPTPPPDVVLQQGVRAYSCPVFAPPALLPPPRPRVPAPLLCPRPVPRLATVPPVSASSPFALFGAWPSLLNPPRPRLAPRKPPLPRPRPRPPVIVATSCSAAHARAVWVMGGVALYWAGTSVSGGCPMQRAEGERWTLARCAAWAERRRRDKGGDAIARLVHAHDPCIEPFSDECCSSPPTPEASTKNTHHVWLSAHAHLY